ncbi:protein NPGR2-like isoform X2 [Phragmites australis]|uniref:protein NPGR2-like isoform X2 n=1 Tax=Phragmites australis TaxID=29695 RepID=UPI002D77AF37|nr:protein NPGR2-like isoform X2 [Phragmites australis]
MVDRKERGRFSKLFHRMSMQCLCSGDQMNGMDEVVQTSEKIIIKDGMASRYSSPNFVGEQHVNNARIEEAELSLQGGGSLNYEEARALLGRVEYQRGHIEEALRVFDGIKISTLIPGMKRSISRKVGQQKPHSHSSSPVMPFHVVTILMETMYLKAIALRDLGKFEDAARECSTILDIVESALPEGLPSNFGNDCNLNETICGAVELLPELWKLGGFPVEAISSYRRALVRNWNLDVKIIARVQKEFAIFLLYSGCEACPPNLQSQLDGLFVTRNNLEEAILLFLILLMKFNLKRVERDPTVMHHLTFALSVSGQLKPLVCQFEELLPGVLDNREWLYSVALCYLASEDDLTALNLLRRELKSGEDSNSLKELLLASKICGENNEHAEGVLYARRALANLYGGCDQMEAVADLLLGISLSNQARYATTDTERASQQHEVLEVLGNAGKKMHGRDFGIMYNLSLENAVQRKLGAAAHFAKKLLKLEAGSELKTWLLIARIMSAQKRYEDAECIVDAALDQAGKWCQGDLLQTKAQIQIAQGQFKKAIDTYTQLLAVIQLRTTSFGAGISMLQGTKADRRLEVKTWYDLALLYQRMLQWKDAELCISKIRAISPYSPMASHATGKLHEAKGFLKEALQAYSTALDLEPEHVPSLISTATVLRQLGERLVPSVRCFLTDALRLDRMNHVAWFNLGLLYEDEGDSSALEAAECFRVAALLEETAPAEPFR